MVVQRFDIFISRPVVIMCEHGSEKRDFHVPVESYDAETDKEIQQKLLELEWVDDLVYYDSVASELRKGVSVPNPRSNDFSGWVPEPGATATEKPRRSDKTTKASQKDHLYAHSYKSKDIMYIFRHYVNTAMYIEQYRQEHTYSGMFRRERNLDHRALSESSLNRIQRRSQRLKPELLQPPAHIRFQHQPSSETTEFIELARQYKVNATPEVLKRPDNDAHLGGVSVMQLGRRSPALMVNRPASGSSDRGGVMLKCRGLQTMNLSIPRKGGPKAKSQQNRVDSATQNCFSGRPMKPFPANGHCNVEELAPHKTLMVTPTNLRTLDLLSSVAIIDKQHTSGNQPTGNQLMNASDQSDPIDASDFVEPTDLVSTETNQDSDDNLVESPREDMIEESPVNPLPPPLTFQVVKKFPEANPDFSINPHPTLQIEGGKIRKRKKKHTSKSLRAKRHLVFPKLESSVDQFHQTPRGNPLGKSYMLVSQGLSRQPLTDDHSVNEKNSHKKSDLYSPRTSTDSSRVKSDLFDREKAATVLEESKLDTLQKECTNSTLGKTVSIMSTSNIELLPTDKHGKCEMMKHYLLDLAADEEDWRLWQQLKATPVEAFNFTAPDEQKTYLDADVAENIEALHKKLTLSCAWNHHPCPVAVFGQKSMTFSRRNPLPLSTAMKNGSLKDMKKLAVTQSQLLPKGSGSPHVASTATTMAHAVYRFFQSHRVPECVGLPFTCTRIQHKQPTSQLPTAKPISADTRHGCYELMLV